MAEGKTDFDDLDCLTARCQAAPRHGKNGKAVLLEAVEGIDEEFEFRETVGHSETRESSTVELDSVSIPKQPPKREHPSLITDVQELFRCVPPQERIYIQYAVAQKVPKIMRQSEVNTLTGKYLELLLQKTPLTSKEEWMEEIKRNESLRTAAIRAADKNERLIYRESYRAADYKKRVQGEKASEKFVDVWRLPHCQKELASGRSGSHSSSNDVIQLKPSPNREDAAESSITSDRQVEAKDVTSSNCQRQLEVVPEEVDEVSVQESSSATDGKETKQSQASKEKTDSVPQEEPAVKAKVDDNSVKQQLKETSAKKDTGKLKNASDKQSAVLAFVKRELDPLFAAKLIDREIYKTVAKKVVQKVLAVHSEDQNAAFLIDESDKVRHLIRGYVKYYRKLSSKASSS